MLSYTSLSTEIFVALVESDKEEVPDCEHGKHLLLSSENSQTFQMTCKQTAGSSGLGDYIGINSKR